MILLLLADLDNAIAKDGEQIVMIAEDLKRFKARTLGHILVMGRKTFEATGELPDREIFVMTRRKTEDRRRVHFFKTEAELDALIEQFPDKKVFLVGGAGVVKTFFHRIDEAFITRVSLHTGGEIRIPSLEDRLQLMETVPLTDNAREEHWRLI